MDTPNLLEQPQRMLGPRHLTAVLLGNLSSSWQPQRWLCSSPAPAASRSTRFSDCEILQE